MPLRKQAILNTLRPLLLIAFLSQSIAPADAQNPISGQPVPPLSQFDIVMTGLMSKWSIPGGALAITKDGRLVFARGYGYADTTVQEPVQPDSLFRLASISKPFTAAAALKLIEQGRLHLTTTAFSVLSNLTPLPGATVDPRIYNITVQNLLEHTGGWDRNIAGDPPFQYVDIAATAFGATPPATPDLLIRYMMGQPLQYTPGTTYAYSNFGYIVLGQIIERVSGQSYASFVNNYILAPAGIYRMQPGASLLSGRVTEEVKYYDYPGAPLAGSAFPPVGAAVPLPYGGFSIELMLANGGWIASPIDVLRFVDNINGQLTPGILNSPPAGFVGYVPPAGAGWGWIFQGSLPGTSTDVHLDTGYQINGKVTFAAFFNTRQGGSPSPDILADTDAQLLQAAQGISTWPSGDLFPMYSGTTSACGFTLPSSGLSIGSAGGTAQASITETNFCAWTAVSNASWLTIASGSPGIGNGAVGFTAAANPLTTQRSGTLTIAGQTFTVTQAGVAATPVALQFYPVAPCRLVDTRAGQGKTGAFGPPALASYVGRDFPILSAGCSIPSTAQAYSLNLTVVPSGPLGFLSTWPAGNSFPGVSTLNSTDGSVIANAAIVPAGSGGAITALASDAANLIIDINGYFAPPGASGLEFFPVTPCRVADTRNGQGKTGAFGPPSLSAYVARDVPISTSPCISGSEQAYSLNVTVVPPGPLGFLSAWPAGQPFPTVSTLNSPDGTVMANAAIIPAGSGGDIDVLASNNTDLIIDINGKFASPAAGGLQFYSVTPCRVADTRTGQPFAGQFGPPSLASFASRDFPIQSSPCGIPSTAKAYALNMTVVPHGTLGFLSAWPAGQPFPTVSTLNSPNAFTIANAAVVPAGTAGAISVLASNATDLIMDVVGYFAP